MRQHIVQSTPLHRLARPEDVAWAVVWLASPASNYIVGEVIDLDGGAQAVTYPVRPADLSPLATTRTSI
jgi:NAD(P)-dependent dehydrogenase (short-subunit alcohol dehydrogenase family)